MIGAARVLPLFDGQRIGGGWIESQSGAHRYEAIETPAAGQNNEAPLIAVVPVNHTDDKHSPSAWKFTNAMPSWSWNGLSGSKAKVEVYSRSEFVELFISIPIQGVNTEVIGYL